MQGNEGGHWFDITPRHHPFNVVKATPPAATDWEVKKLQKEHDSKCKECKT